MLINIYLVFNPVILFKTNGIIRVDGVQADINLLLNDMYKPAVTEVTLMDNCNNASELKDENSIKSAETSDI